MLFTMTDETLMIVTVGIILAFIVFIIILLVGIKRDRRRYKEEKALIIDGLLSRSAINSEINSYISKSGKDESFSLIAIEIENFDEVIHAFGKPEAKKALERVAYFMARALPRRVSLGNFHITRFLILMKSEYDRMQALTLAKKCLAIINKPIKVFKDTYINLEASIGICYYPVHGFKFKELQNSLMVAINEARSTGVNEIKVYGEGKIDEKENLAFHMALKEAMEEKQFVLFYQPIINITEEKFYGVEALVRWNHPSRGLISPQNFLDVMEHSGDINWIGTWGLETLIQEYYEIRREFPYLNYQISLNLSVKQLLSDKIAVDFSKIIKKYKMNPQIIVLELAEFSAYQKYAIIKQNISKLKKIGFKISLNAYGIDANTLMTLNEMPIDLIKLDKQFFIKEKDSYLKERLLGMIVEWGQKNSKDVIAEGIEDQEMIDFCRKSEINFVQGYFYSKPISANEILIFLKEQNWVKVDKTLDELDEVMEGEVEPPAEDADETLKSCDDLIDENETETDNYPPFPM